MGKKRKRKIRGKSSRPENPTIDCAKVRWLQSEVQSEIFNLEARGLRDSSQFSSDSSDQWISFYPRERKNVYVSLVSCISVHDQGFTIKTTNDMGRKQYVSFLHQCRISFPLAILPLSRYQPLFLSFVPSWSLPCAQPVVVRGVCSGSLTCCMLFCPGPSARFCFSEPFHAALILSGTPERHSRNKKPAYCVPRCEIL